MNPEDARALRTILFLDDWPIQERRGLERKWFQPEPWPGLAPAHDTLLQYSFGSQSAIRDPQTRRWRLWAWGMTDRSKGDFGVGLFAYDSEDGLTWTPHLCEPPVDSRATPAASHLVFSGEESCSGALPFLDEREPDPSRRYKLAYCDTSRRLLAQQRCRIATSPDGLRWSIDRAAIWRQQLVDTAVSIVFNPYSGRYQFTARPIWGDRRVALYQTNDWKSFDEPLVILHPDPADPPGVEFYGMPQFFYEGYFLGLLWRQHTPFGDSTLPARMKGKVDTELVYSINGTHWNRTSRQPFLPDRRIGGHCFGNEYPSCICQDDEGWLRLYTTSCVGEHNDWSKFKPDETIARLTILRLRRDGFCAMESRTDRGEMLLRPLIARGGEMLLNAATSRFGKLRAELRSVPENQPIPGYELANCAPAEGDGHFLRLLWKDRTTLDPIRGLPFRAYIELDQARLYAVRLEADLLYACVPQRTLAGDYVPKQLVGWGDIDWAIPGE